MAYKESILFTGGDNVSKTSLLLEIAATHPESKCIMFDFENKVDKIRDGYYGDLKNLEVIDILGWDDVEDGFTRVKAELHIGDWYLVDGLDKAWDIIQTTWDKDNPDHEADMWQFCKKRHNKRWLDIACGRAPFNVAMSAWCAPNDSFNIDRERDDQVKADLMLWKQYGFRPGGEKRNTSRFDTVFALKTRLNPQKFYVSTYKDKVRPYIDGGSKSLWMEYTHPFWPHYVDLCAKAIEDGQRAIPIS